LRVFTSLPEPVRKSFLTDSGKIKIIKKAVGISDRFLSLI